MAHKDLRSLRSMLLLFSCVLAAGVLTLICDICLADTISQASAKFYHANTYYSEAEYDKAIEAYEGALNLGFESGNLYYNLGNSYFKKGELGKAIFNYEKAMRLIPRDSDLKSNCEYVKSLISGGVVEAKEKWCRIIFNRIFSLFTINEMAFSLAVIFTLILSVILATAYILSIKKYRFGALLVLLIIFVLFFMAILEKIAAVGKEAVIVAEKTNAKFEPFNSATTHFTLYEGAKVAIVSSKYFWYKVERPDKKTGWVKNLSLETF